MATASGSARATVAIAAVLGVMAEVRATSGSRKDRDQVRRNGCAR